MTKRECRYGGPETSSCYNPSGCGCRCVLPSGGLEDGLAYMLGEAVFLWSRLEQPLTRERAHELVDNFFGE